MIPFDLERLSPARWFADTTEPVDHPAYLVLTVLLFLGLAGGVYLRVMADHLFDGHRFKQRQAARLATMAIWLSASGLVVLLFRWQPVPFLSKRIWLYLWWIAAAASAGYAIFYYRRRYPGELATYLDNERRRRYLPKHGATVRVRRRARRRK